jgi:hypothetical protein
MQTRRHVLASITALAAFPAVALQEQALGTQAHLEAILKLLRECEGGTWTAHVDKDFILISKKL